MLTLQTSFVALMVASAIATAVINNVVKVINKYGNEIGVYAYKGEIFIGMTCAATLLVLLTGFMWLYEWRVQRRGGLFFGRGEGDFE